MFAPESALAASRGALSRDLVKTAPVRNYGDFDKLAVSRDLGANQPFAVVSDLVFSGKEGDYGTFSIALREKPESNVVVGFGYSNTSFLMPDADNDFSNGTDTQIIFTPLDWDLKRTVKFVAEIDRSTANRSEATSFIVFKLTFTDTKLQKGERMLEVPIPVTNVAAYNPNKPGFNIDLDFRAVSEDPYWTKARKSLAQSIADIAAGNIANEYADTQLFNQIPPFTSLSDPAIKNFVTSRAFDDVVVFVLPFDPKLPADSTPGGGAFIPAFGGATLADSKPKAGLITLSKQAFLSKGATGNNDLSAVVLHEIGHVLGLVGKNKTGLDLINTTTSPATFTGSNTVTANGGNPLVLDLPLSGTNDTVTSNHPESNAATTPPRYHSSMSYLFTNNPATGGTYDVCKVNACNYTALDRALLKDHGYTLTP
ncbi:MAG: hypothetical protein RBJ76_13600 [Stenomitos frigidus ULC029]